MDKSPILEIYRSEKTVFSVKDMALIWGESNKDLVKKRIHRYSKSGKLFSVKKGFYAKDEEYDKEELVTKIYSPSYISFETVLARAGVTFQYYSRIFAASYLSREIKVDDQTYEYRKIKKSVLVNDTGIKNEKNYSIATPERAFLDLVYLNKNYYFDNLSSLNWEKIYQILPIYSNKRMVKTVKEHQDSLKEE